MRDMRLRYREAKRRKERMRLLAQVSETMDCHRKHAGRLMRGRPPRLERPLRQREPVYPERLIEILEVVWEATQHLWSVRLKSALPLWLGWIKKRWDLSAEEERLLLAMSPATMDRRLGPCKRKLGRRLYGQTKPGRWLRQTIPIQTESWNVPEPGWLEVDTVSHSGPSAAGLFAYTLNEVDLFSGWVEMRAMLGKSAAAVVALSDEMRRAQPFGRKGMDTDNGEEFINHELDRYCRKTGVQRFRSRPYKKDDQAHIEQKNGTHVRRLIGWDRYDTEEAKEAMNALYRGEWRLLANLFLPSVKLANKVRVGSKIKRVYEEARTPLDRLLESGQGDRHKLDELRRMRARMDPFDLSKAVDRKLRAIWKLASRGPIKAAATPYAATKPQWDRLAAGVELPSPFNDWTPDSDLARVERGLWRDGFFGNR